MTKAKAYIGATIITGYSSDDMIRNGAILVNTDGRIEAIGEAGTIRIPCGCALSNLSGQYVMPGLINAHMHLFSDGSPKQSELVLGNKRFLSFTSTVAGSVVLDWIYKKNVRAAVRSGVTSIRDAGSYCYKDCQLKHLIDTGRMIGPNMVCCGTYITTTRGHGYGLPGSIAADGVEESVAAVSRQLQHKTAWIKICSTGGVSDAAYVGEAGAPQMPLEVIAAICEQAHRRNVLVAAHCESTQGMWDALHGGVDSIEHGAYIPNEMAELFLSNPRSLRGYTALVPTLSASSAFCELSGSYLKTEKNRIILENADIVRKGSISALKTAIKFGIQVGVGTDAGVPFVYPENTYRELLYFQEHTDLTPKQIIDIATGMTAQAVGIGHLTGTLRKGLFADFIILKCNPIDDLRKIGSPEAVFLHGKKIEIGSKKRRHSVNISGD